MNRLLYLAKGVGNRAFGTVTDEWLWRWLHLLDRDWADRSVAPESIAHPHRKLLLERIEAHAPFRSVLEVGCAGGPNLYLLAKRHPDVQFFGVDISRRAIAAGVRLFGEERLHNVALAVGKADDLREFGDRSVDVVFTDATLIYIGPERIHSVLRNLLRVARRALIVNEYNTAAGTSRINAHWAYDWKTLLAQFVPEQNIVITRITEECWPGTWAQYGCVADATLQIS